MTRGDFISKAAGRSDQLSEGTPKPDVMADNMIYDCFDRTCAALKKMKRIYVNREWRQSAFPRIKSGVRRDRLRLAKPLRRERTYRNGLARQAEASFVLPET